MINYRGFPDLTSELITEEQSSPNAVNLVAGSIVGLTPNFYPKVAGNIIGVKFKIIGSVTASSAGAVSTTVGSLINSIQVKQGNNILLPSMGFSGLRRIFNLLTGLDIADVPLTPAASASASGTIETPFIPFNWQTSVIPYIVMSAVNLSTIANAASASLSVQVEFLHGPTTLNDVFAVITTPQAISAGVDVELAPYITVKNPVKYLGIDFDGADSNLNYVEVDYGQSVHIDKIGYSALRAVQTPYSFFTAIPGFLIMPIAQSTVFTTGTTTQPAKLFVNLSTSVPLTFYILEA